VPGNAITPPRMQVTVKLGSTLREKVPQYEGGEGVCELPARAPSRVKDVMDRLGLREEDVNLIYRNHVAVTPRAQVSDGDRLAFFPPNFIHFSQFYIKREEE